MELTDRDLFWLAGLFEGEGCADWRKRERTLRLRIQMTDRDIVERVARIWDTSLCGPYSWPKKPQNLPIWTAAIQGRKAVLWALALLGLMGQRRKAKLTELLLKLREKSSCVPSTVSS
jgi:hypothetical protein